MSRLRKIGFTPVFVVGSPRSGTTWIQSLLDYHPGVATGRETHLFSGYLQPLADRWEFDAGRAERIGSYYDVGLPTVMERAEFTDLCRKFAGGVLSKIARREPGADVVLEKTPHHASHAELILETIPGARFIHMIRDPRAVVASLQEASRGWGHYWAPSGLIDCARLWKTAVEQGRRIGDLTDNYVEVHYESLHGDTPRKLAGLYSWLDLDAEREFSEEAAEACSLDRLQEEDRDGGKSESGEALGPTDDAPDGFFREGATEGWRSDLRDDQIRLVEYLCSTEMEELGYAETERGYALGPLRVAAKRLVERVRGALDWRLDRLSARL